MEPAFAVERFSRFFFHFVVAGEDIFAFYADFTDSVLIWRIDFKLQIFNSFSAASDRTTVKIMGISDKRSTFGHAVANRKPDAALFEKLFDLRIESGTADKQFEVVRSESAVYLISYF